MAFNITEIQNGSIELFGTKSVIDKSKRVVIIGLGGTGTDTLLKTKDAIMNRFQLDGNQLPANIELLAIDTDKDVLNKSIGMTKLDPVKEFIQLTDNNLADMLKNREKLPDFYKNWVNPGLAVPPGVKPGQNGAGAVRQLGRCLLMANYANVKNSISSKITSVQQANRNSITDIIILSGISGGTGSGTFIDMGYIVRNICQFMGGANNFHITAYLYLPDVNKNNPDVPQSSYKFIECNGYAALKDLDYFMSISHKSQLKSDVQPYKFVQRYSHDETIVMDMAPFDSTYLISGVPNVINPLKDGYSYSINITADSIVNFIAGSQQMQGRNNLGAGVKSVDINGAAMIAASGSNIKKGDGTNILANYDYKILGASTATLPMKNITEFIAGKFLAKVDILKNQTPLSNDFEKFYKGLGMQNLETQVFNRLSKPRTDISGNDFKDNPSHYNGVMMNNLNKCFNDAKANIPTYVKQEIESLKTKIETNINNSFIDIAQGPFFANTLMAAPKNGVIARLIELASRFSSRANEYTSESAKCNAAAQEAYNSAEGAIMGKAGRYQNYINFKTQQCEYSIRAEICKKLSEAINSAGKGLTNDQTLVQYIQEKNKNVYDVYTKILTTLKEKFKDMGAQIIAHDNGKVFVWDIVKLNDVQDNIEKSINSMNLDTTLNDLLNDMISRSDKWCKSKSTLSEFSDFLAKGFANILGQSMDNYLKSIPEKVIKDNIERLDRDAAEHFPSLQGIAPIAANISDKVTVPVSAPVIQNAVADYLAAKGSQKKPETSYLGERISWTRASIGIPIFQYAYLQMFENSYETVDINHKQGMHLYENEGVCGRDYPALLPDFFYANGYGNEHEARRRKKMGDLFDKAYSLDIIGQDPNAAYIRLTSDKWAEDGINSILNKYKTNEEAIASGSLGLEEMQDCINELKKLKDENAVNGKLFMTDTADTGDNNTNIYYAKESFIRMPEAVPYVEAELNKKGKIESIISRLESMTTSFDDEKSRYMRYIYALAFDIITMEGIKYVYGDDDNKIELANRAKDKPFWSYKAFNEFNASILDIVADTIDERIDEAQGSMDSLEELKKFCEKTLKSMQPEFVSAGKLDNTEENVPIKTFYSKMNMFLKDEIKSYTDMGI